MNSNLEPKELLRAELLRRIKKNPRYSLRSFARALGVSHTTLSLILSGRRRASHALLARFADNMGLGPDERGRLLDNHLGTNSPSAEIDLDLFNSIADWRHYAVLSLLDLPSARFEAAWIGRKLAISQHEAQDIMDRLLRLGLAAEVHGKMRQATPPIRIKNELSTPATRRFHRGLIERALEALENDTIDKRDFSSMTFAMDESLIPYAY